MYSKAAERFGEALFSIVEIAEQNGATYDELLESLESAMEMVREWKQEREAKDER